MWKCLQSTADTIVWPKQGRTCVPTVVIPRCVCLSEAKTSHSHKTWTEMFSSVPHILQAGLLLSPITYKCLLKVLCLVRLPITTLDCALLMDNNRALVTRLGPEINSRTCLCVLQGPRYNTRCCFSTQHFIFLLIFCLESPTCSITTTCAWTTSVMFVLLPVHFYTVWTEWTGCYDTI